MMARVAFRGLYLTLFGLLAISIAGCAEQPEREPSGIVGEEVGEVVDELDLRTDFLDDDDNTGHDDRGLPREGNTTLGAPTETGLGSDGPPGADRIEPDPVPWCPRYLAANDA